MADPIWTLEALQQHFSALFAAHEQADKILHNADQQQIDQRFQAVEKSISIAHAVAERAQEISNNSAEKWRENANEWRGSMTDRERTFVSRPEFDSVKERLDKQEGRGHGMAQLWGWIVAGVMMVVALFGNVHFGKGP